MNAWRLLPGPAQPKVVIYSILQWTHHGRDTVDWVTRIIALPDLNPSVQLLDFCASNGFLTTNTMFNHKKGLQMHTLDTLFVLDIEGKEKCRAVN